MAVDAVRCAIDIQDSARTRNRALPPGRRLEFRIGITIGDVVERGGDLLGDGVNIAARLESLAEPGGICVSRSVHEAVANKVSVPFRDIGERQVKNIPNRVHAFVVAWPGLNPELHPEDRRGRGPARGKRSRAALAVLGGAGALVAAVSRSSPCGRRRRAPRRRPSRRKSRRSRRSRQRKRRRPIPRRSSRRRHRRPIRRRRSRRLPDKAGSSPTRRPRPSSTTTRGSTKRAAMRSRRAAPTGRSRRSASTISIRICATPPSCACRTGAPAPARSFPS